MLSLLCFSLLRAKDCHDVISVYAKDFLLTRETGGVVSGSHPERHLLDLLPEVERPDSGIVDVTDALCKRGSVSMEHIN